MYTESNSGIFTVKDIMENNSTVAHEYGHSLGWFEFEEANVNGGFHDTQFEDGIPGIMAGRGTPVPEQYGYDYQLPGEKTIDPNKRRVKKSDVLNIINPKIWGLSQGQKVKLGKAKNIFLEYENGR